MTTNWIKIEDQEPPNEVSVLIAILDDRTKIQSYFIQIACRINDAWIDDRDGELISTKYGEITHWMPLPDEPNKE